MASLTIPIYPLYGPCIILTVFPMRPVSRLMCRPPPPPPPRPPITNQLSDNISTHTHARAHTHTHTHTHTHIIIVVLAYTCTYYLWSNK